MKILDAIKAILTERMDILQSTYKFRETGVFGSYVRGEQKKRSGVDILVDFEEPISLLKFIEMESYLSELIGMKVDLVMKDALKPRIGRHILDEVVKI